MYYPAKEDVKVRSRNIDIQNIVFAEVLHSMYNLDN